MRLLSALAALVLSAATLTGAATAADAAPPGRSADTVTPAVSINYPNEAAAWHYFRGAGLTQKQTAGVLGNLDVESGMRPHQEQIGGGPGRGIAQWSVGGRWDTYPSDNVVWWAQHHDGGRFALHVQLSFTWYELNHGYGIADLKNTTTVRGAVLVFQNQFEGCDPASCHTDQRVSYAMAALDRYT